MLKDIPGLIVHLLISIVVCIGIIFFYDYTIKNKGNEEIIVFSGKNIIEHKKLLIKKAILNNEDITNKEKELEELITTIDLMLEEYSKIYSKPIYQKEMIFGGNVKDITPIIEKSLMSKGLLR